MLNAITDLSDALCHAETAILDPEPSKPFVLTEGSYAFSDEELESIRHVASTTAQYNVDISAGSMNACALLIETRKRPGGQLVFLSRKVYDNGDIPKAAEHTASWESDAEPEATDEEDDEFTLSPDEIKMIVSGLKYLKSMAPEGLDKRSVKELEEKMTQLFHATKIQVSADQC